MKVKQFRLPTFDEFFNQTHGLQWEVRDEIGEFEATIRAVSYTYVGDSYGLVASVRSRWTGRDVCYHSWFEWKQTEDKNILKSWYELVAKELNECFTKYVTNTYLEDEYPLKPKYKVGDTVYFVGLNWGYSENDPRKYAVYTETITSFCKGPKGGFLYTTNYYHSTPNGMITENKLYTSYEEARIQSDVLNKQGDKNNEFI